MMKTNSKHVQIKLYSTISRHKFLNLPSLWWRNEGVEAKIPPISERRAFRLRIEGMALAKTGISS